MSEVQTAPKLRKLSAITKHINGIKKTYDTTPNCSNDDGYKEAKEKYNELKELRVETEKARVSEKAKHLAAGKAVDDQSKKIAAYIEPRELKYKEAFTAVDDEKKRIKQAKIDEQAEIISAMKARFDAMDDLLLEAHELESVNAAIEILDTLDLQPFQDRSIEAAEKSEKLIEILNRRKERLQSEADAAAVVEQQRINNEKVAEQLAADQKKFDDAQAEQQRKLDEQAEQQRVENEKRAAELKAQQDEIAAKQTKLDNAERERKIKAEVAAKAEREKVEAAAVAEAKRINDIETARLEEQRKAEEAAQKVIDDKKEADKKEAEEKAEAEKRAALAPIAEQLRNWFESIQGVPVVVFDPKDSDTRLAYNTLVDAMYSMDNATAQLIDRTLENK